MIGWFKVNPIGILLGAIVYILFGIVFYSKWGLGRLWVDLVKHMQKQADNTTAVVYIGAFMSAVLIAYVIGCFANLIQAKTLSTGALIGFLVWLGFILPTTFSPVLFGKKPIEMFYLDAVFYLITYIVVSVIVVKFNRY